jgi:hypothetical protein
MTASTTVSTSHQNAGTAEPRYFDLLTYAHGYVSRIREVKGERSKSKASIYCTISVPLDPKTGDNRNARWTVFDVRVCESDNVTFINSLREDLANGRRTRIACTIGDIYGQPFVTKYMSNGQQVEEVRAQFKGRLIKSAPAASVEFSPLKTVGLGYVNRIHFLDNGDCKVDIGAFHGLREEGEKLNFTYFRSLIRKDDALNLAKIQQIKELQNVHGDSAVTVGFELTAPMVQGFVFRNSTKGNNGKLGASCTADLANIRWIRVNGVRLQDNVAPVESATDATPAPVTETTPSSMEETEDMGYAALY